jgi:hypothetical protein
MWTNTFYRSCINKDQIHFIFNIALSLEKTTWLKFSSSLGIWTISLSLVQIRGCLLVYCGAKWYALLLESYFLLVDGIYFVKLGFILLSCGIGKEISVFCWYFLLVSCYTCLKPLEEYKGLHPLRLTFVGFSFSRE